MSMKNLMCMNFAFLLNQFYWDNFLEILFLFLEIWVKGYEHFLWLLVMITKLLSKRLKKIHKTLPQLHGIIAEIVSEGRAVLEVCWVFHGRWKKCIQMDKSSLFFHFSLLTL